MKKYVLTLMLMAAFLAAMSAQEMEQTVAPCFNMGSFDERQRTLNGA